MISEQRFHLKKKKKKRVFLLFSDRFVCLLILVFEAME